MLKIKDNVPIEELEKFGFKKGIDDSCHEALIKDLKYNDYIAVYEDKSILVDVEDLMVSEDRLPEIQELIQAGLVEKVGGEDE